MSQPAPTIFGTLAYPLAHCVGGGNSGTGGTSGKPGPYENGTDLWYVIAENPDAITGPNIVAYKSTDGGVTRTREVMGPLCSTADYRYSRVYPFYIGSGTVINIGYQNPSGELCICEFDMAGPTFSAENPSGVVISPANVGNFAQLVHGSGDITLLYYELGQPLFAITYGGSPVAWQAPVNVDDGSSTSPPGYNFFFEAASLNVDGDVLMLYGRGSGNGFRSGTLMWAIYDGVSVTSRGNTPLVASANSGTWWDSLYDANSDSAVFPIFRTVKVGVDNRAAVSLLIGTPSDAPVWRVVDLKIYGLVDPLPFGSFGFTVITSNAAGTHFDVFWVFQFNFSRYLTIQQSSAGSLNGPWSVPATYYNENLALPTPPTLLQQMGPIYAKTLADDTVVVIVGLIVTSPAFWWGTPYSWGAAAPPPVSGATLEAVQVISGGIGSPSLVKATGPVTVSGTGGFSATSVAVGVYTLSQNPIPGFTAGSWVLTINAGSPTLSGSTLTMHDGDSATVTITDTFVDGPIQIQCANSTYEVGVFYSSFITVQGGVPPYLFEIVAGQLAPGLTLNPTTGEISGIPTEPGPFNYTVRVTDSDLSPTP